MKRILREVLVLLILVCLFLSQVIQPVFGKDFSQEKYPVYPTVCNFSMRYVAAHETIVDFYSDSPGTYYYLVYESSALASDANKIIAQADGVAKGTGAANPGLNSVNITGLEMQKTYLLHIDINIFILEFNNCYD